MMKNLLRVLCLCLWMSVSLEASLRLYNDTPYKLRAIIRAADGTYLSEMIILPFQYNTWSNDYFEFGNGGERPPRSLTPYIVHWYCIDGSEYGICQNVPASSLSIASSCNGTKMCKTPQKKKNTVYGPNEDDEDGLSQQENGKRQP